MSVPNAEKPLIDGNIMKKEEKKFASYPEDIKEEVEELFEKVFNFNKPDGSAWRLPVPHRIFPQSQIIPIWTDLLALKEELNELKRLLNDKEINEWRKHTQNCHFAGDVVHHLKQTVMPDLCTQSWCKFHEILFSFDIVPDIPNSSYYSVHLCEAPGAFISSLNHFLKTHRQVKWRWHAVTLNPYYEGNALDNMISDDRLLSVTRKNWIFGHDDTGDIMNYCNLQTLIEVCDGQTVDLVTSDGNANAHENPDEQEMQAAALNFAEIVTALHILQKGGTYILKAFTFFEHPAVCMMYMLNCCFQYVDVIKPATSKPGNSEVYVVCKGYCGIERIHLQLRAMVEHLNPDVFTRRALFLPDDIPFTFMEEMRECASFFTTFQGENIRRNLATCDGPLSADEMLRIKQARELTTHMWARRMDIKYIRDSCRLHYVFKFRSLGFSSFAYTIRQRGNFYERQEQISASWRERIERERPEGNIRRLIARNNRGTTEWLQDSRNLVSSDPMYWQPTYGKPINRILNSRFCLPHLLQEVIAALDNAVCLKKKYIGEFRSFIAKNDSSLDNIPKYIYRQLSERFKADNKCFLLRGENIFNNIFVANSNSQTRFAVEVASFSSGTFSILQYFSKPELSGEDTTKNFTNNNGFLFDYICSSLLRSAASKCQTIKAALVIADISTDLLSARHFQEIYFKGQSITAVILALKSLEVGGTLVMAVDQIVSRFSASIIYILYRLFRKMAIFEVSRSICLSGRIIVFQEFKGKSDTVVDYLFYINENMCEQNNEQRVVLQLVPYTCIFEDIFNGYLIEKCNIHLLKLLSEIIDFEKQKFPLMTLDIRAPSTLHDESKVEDT